MFDWVLDLFRIKKSAEPDSPLSPTGKPIAYDFPLSPEQQEVVAKWMAHNAGRGGYGGLCIPDGTMLPGTINDGGPNFPMGVEAQDHTLGKLEWKKTSWVAPEGVKTWAGDSCPKCGAKVNTNGGHGPWCPEPLCKWGWETEMDGSPLIHPNLKVWSEPKP